MPELALNLAYAPPTHTQTEVEAQLIFFRGKCLLNKANIAELFHWEGGCSLGRQSLALGWGRHGQWLKYCGLIFQVHGVFTLRFSESTLSPLPKSCHWGCLKMQTHEAFIHVGRRRESLLVEGWAYPEFDRSLVHYPELQHSSAQTCPKQSPGSQALHSQ